MFQDRANTKFNYFFSYQLFGLVEHLVPCSMPTTLPMTQKLEDKSVEIITL